MNTLYCAKRPLAYRILDLRSVYIWGRILTLRAPAEAISVLGGPKAKYFGCQMDMVFRVDCYQGCYVINPSGGKLNWVVWWVLKNPSNCKINYVLLWWSSNIFKIIRKTWACTMDRYIDRSSDWSITNVQVDRSINQHAPYTALNCLFIDLLVLQSWEQL